MMNCLKDYSAHKQMVHCSRVPVWTLLLSPPPLDLHPLQRWRDVFGGRATTGDLGFWHQNISLHLCPQKFLSSFLLISDYVLPHKSSPLIETTVPAGRTWTHNTVLLLHLTRPKVGILQFCLVTVLFGF